MKTERDRRRDENVMYAVGLSVCCGWCRIHAVEIEIKTK